MSIYLRTVREIMRQDGKFVANHVENYKGRSGELQESIYKGQKIEIRKCRLDILDVTKFYQFG